MDILDDLESEVRYYCRRWPAVFAHAQGSYLCDEHGTRYLDFFTGAGSLNYGHNPPLLIEAIIAYLRDNGVLNSLDMTTTAKRQFMLAFKSIILEPRTLNYRMQFVGPTGTDAVEAALRLARKVTGRARVVSVSGGYHGMTLRSEQVSSPPGSRHLQRRSDVTFVPHEMDASLPDLAFDALQEAFSDAGAEVAALIIETVQGEGGVRVSSDQYLRFAQKMCRSHNALLIVDDIQAGCGRTGTFFSFESSGIKPDIVCMSKSLSGAGLPLSMLLINPAMDQWEPGEHTGTFRGNNLAFVAGRTALEHWWSDGGPTGRTDTLSAAFLSGLTEIAESCDWLGSPRGKGFMLGLPCSDAPTADLALTAAFNHGLLVETCGRGEIVKLMPPLTVTEAELAQALDILRLALAEVSGKRTSGRLTRNSP